MPRIIRVDVLDDDTLDIELSNGNLILFKLRPEAAGPCGCLGLSGLTAREKPTTDGASVSWQDGTRLTLSQILSCIQNAE
jgi:hypothetical protein